VHPVVREWLAPTARLGVRILPAPVCGQVSETPALRYVTNPLVHPARFRALRFKDAESWLRGQP
jgi:hypothetical protein